MEIIIIVAILGGLVFFLFRGFDTNKDGKVTVAEVKSVADVNNDGKVDIKDVKVAATKAKTVAKKTAANIGAKTKTAVKKATTARKPVAKKAAK